MQYQLWKTLARGAVAGTIGLGALTSSALADNGTQMQAAVLAGSCANCHGTEGRLSGVVPRLAGQPEAVLAAQLRAFRDNQTPDTTIMNRIATGYTDEEIDMLARYFASVGD